MRTLIFLAVAAIVIGLAGASIGASIEPAAYPRILIGWGVCCAAYVALVAWRIAR